MRSMFRYLKANTSRDSSVVTTAALGQAGWLFVLTVALTGCVTTQPQADGSTKVHFSLGDPAKTGQHAVPSPLAPGAQPVSASTQNSSVRATETIASAIRSTALGGIFSKHPYDGTPKTYFPRVAVTVKDWSRSDCWIATATIWWNRSRSEAVPAFSVCWGKSVGYAVNNAANLHLFMQQMAVEHSGNVRTMGPKPPMLAIPDRQPISERQQLAFQGFIQQLVLDTGWQPGAPTNLWVVGYDAKATVGATDSVAIPSTAKPVDAKAKTQLEQALACTAIGQRFDLAETLLKQAGRRPDQGITPVTLGDPVKVYGLSVHKVAISRDGGEQIYRSYLDGVSIQQLVKSASLKLGKDGKTYGRLTKVGVLSAGMEGSETTLTCTVSTEGSEG